MTPCFLATCRDRASLSTVTPKNIFPRHVRKFRLGRPTRSPTPGREHATGSRASPRRDRARAPHAVHRRGEARARGGPPGALSRRHASFLVVPAVRGAPIALIRGPECAGVPRVPRTPVSKVASGGDSCREVKAEAWCRAWFAFTGAAEAAALEPGVLCSCGERARRARARDCRLAWWYRAGARAAEGKAPWTAMILMT